MSLMLIKLKYLKNLSNPGLHEYEQDCYLSIVVNINDLDLEIQKRCADDIDDLDKLTQQREYDSIKLDLEDTFEVFAGIMGSIPADNTLINSGNYNEENYENSEDADFKKGQVSEGDSDVGAGGTVLPQDIPHLWSGKYRPHNPRSFNKVYTGYDWIQHNRKPYDTDNSLRKIIHGYKFHIFYSIVQKVWNYSYYHAFRYQFQHGLFPLWFSFRNWKYRRFIICSFSFRKWKYRRSLFLFLLLFSFMKVFYFISFHFLVPVCLFVFVPSFVSLI